MTKSELEKEIITLKADIAYAIGKLEGLGYPSEYLKRRYPELNEWIDVDQRQPVPPQQEKE
jgi:hypothetical protein